MQYEGWRRYGVAMSFGKPEWRQCENEAEVIIEFKKDDLTQKLPGCKGCLQKCRDTGMDILSVEPIESTDTTKEDQE